MKSLNIEHTEVFTRNWNCLNDDKVRFIFNQGGSRSSKTYSICQMLIVYCLSNPKKGVSIIRKSFPTLRASIMRDFFSIMKELELYDNEFIEKLFVRREKAIDNNILIMDKLHNNSPDQYPLLPISSNIKDKLFSGIIGGKKKEKNRKTRRYIKKYNKTKKRRI